MGHEEFYNGQRVVIVAREPDETIRDRGGEIPIGTTGTIYDCYTDSSTNPETEEEEPIHTVVFDIPYTPNSCHRNHFGNVMFDVFSSMIEPIEEPEIAAIDIDGLF
jgi:hypothetical protein